MNERDKFEAWAKNGNWKATESMWAAWEARASQSEAVERDAARYRFIKDGRNDDLLMELSMEIPSADWDTAIDAAMRRTK